MVEANIPKTLKGLTLQKTTTINPNRLSRAKRISMEIEDKRRLAIDDFNQLIIPGTIGFYNSCEITQIYLLNTNTQKVDNFYALASFSKPLVRIKNHTLPKLLYLLMIVQRWAS